MSKNTGLSAKFILLVTMIYAVLTLITLAVQIKNAEQTRGELIASRDELACDIIALTALCEDGGEDVATIAREKLAMADDGEVILYYKP